MTQVPVTIVVGGATAGELQVLGQPLSLWGGYDIATGTVIDSHHPDLGRRLAGKVVAMIEARGSSSSSSALVEAARCGTAPAAIILGRVDPILVIGSLVAEELYGISIPICLVSPEDWPKLQGAGSARIDPHAATLTLSF